MTDSTKISGGIQNLADKKWFEKNPDSSVWVRIYTSLGLPHKNFFEELSKIKFGGGLSGEIRLAHGHIENMEIPSIITFPFHALEDGSITISMDLSKKITLPKTNYIFFVTPLSKEHEVKTAFDEIACLIKLHFGHNFIRDVIYEGSVKTDGQMSHFSEVFKTPSPKEGPFIHSENWLDTAEIRNAIEGEKNQKIKERLKLSLKYFNKAMQEDSFGSYCIAMDLFCGTKSLRAMSSKIQKCYGFRSQQEAEKETGFKQIIEWRTKFIHHGIEPIITADVERYLQLLYLDVLRFELKLENKNHSLAARINPHFDLSSIGVTKNTQT